MLTETGSVFCVASLSRTRAPSILAARVERAAPAAPMDRPKIRIAFPIALNIFIPIDIFIEILALPIDLKIAALAL